MLADGRGPGEGGRQKARFPSVVSLLDEFFFFAAGIDLKFARVF